METVAPSKMPKITQPQMLHYHSRLSIFNRLKGFDDCVAIEFAQHFQKIRGKEYSIMVRDFEIQLNEPIIINKIKDHLIPELIIDESLTEKPKFLKRLRNRG